MAGYVKNRGKNTWLVTMPLGRDPDTKKRKFHYHTVHGTKKDAEKYLAKIVRDKDLGVFIEPTSTTVNEYLNQWLEIAAKPKLRERTYVEYSNLLNRYVKNILGNKKLAEVQPLDVQALYTHMLAKGLSARTVKYTHNVLSSAFKQAIKWKLIMQNPVAQAELPKQTKIEMKVMSPEESKLFLEVASKHRLGVFFHLMLLTGMRPSEILGLQWEDIDLEKHLVIVQRSVVWRTKGSGWYFSQPKTLRSNRNIPLSNLLIVDIKEHRHKQLEERLKEGSKYENHNLVFATSTGKPFMQRNIIRYFKEIIKESNLPKTLRLYDLRHTCATLLLFANENPKVVAERLGHASVTLTLDTYSHVLPTMQKAATDKLEEILYKNSLQTQCRQ